ncbi:MAG TPA: hypothetical protein VNJ52_03845 [Patescibacteria group bacterium]|nr:hypothetical protein [Patescibacteria group bacterium]
MNIGKQKKWAARIATLASFGLFLFATACSQAPAVPTASRAAQSGTAAEAEYRSAARSVLGDESQVMLSGDLAHNQHIQLLVVNRLSPMPGKADGGVLVSRAAILEKESENWREIFLADDHLKNEKGFLEGTPLDSVGVWRLQYVRKKDGLTMFFTPLRQAAGADPATVEIRWNPRMRRYQAFDRQAGHFLAEALTPEGMPSFLMKR